MRREQESGNFERKRHRYRKKREERASKRINNIATEPADA